MAYFVQQGSMGQEVNFTNIVNKIACQPKIFENLENLGCSSILFTVCFANLLKSRAQLNPEYVEYEYVRVNHAGTKPKRK